MKNAIFMEVTRDKDGKNIFININSIHRFYEHSGKTFISTVDSEYSICVKQSVDEIVDMIKSCNRMNDK